MLLDENDPDLHFAKGGVIEALDEAKRQGKVRQRCKSFAPDGHLELYASGLERRRPARTVVESPQIP